MSPSTVMIRAVGAAALLAGHVVAQLRSCVVSFSLGFCVGAVFFYSYLCLANGLAASQPVTMRRRRGLAWMLRAVGSTSLAPC